MKLALLSSCLVICCRLAVPAFAQGGSKDLFLEAFPLVEISDGLKTPVFSAAIPPWLQTPEIPYPDPLEVPAPHPAQTLTVFYPHTPSLGDRFPTIVWASAGAFSRANPPAVPGSQNRFLYEALVRGWCVVSVGSTGVDSCPTPGQLARCFSNPQLACPAGMPCRDYSLWFEPQTDPASAWNDFDYFIGEKDFFMAMQYVTSHAASLYVDEDRLVLSGLSTGGIYSCLVGYEVAKAWKQEDFPTRTLSAQAQVQPKVAALVLFESVAWLPGYGPTFPSAHWPRSSDPMSPLYFRRASMLEEVGGGTTGMGFTAEGMEILRSNSVSAWIRDRKPRVPVYFASGDGGSTLSNFNVNYVTSPGAYQRAGTEASPIEDRDPLLLLNNGLAQHDYWHALFQMEDLRLVYPKLHGRHSRFACQGGLVPPATVNWSRVDPRFSSTGLPPTSAAEIPLIDTTFGHVGGVTSVDNPLAFWPALDWAEREACVERSEAVECRNGGPNYAVLRATTAFANGSILLTVDMNQVDERYDHVHFIAYLEDPSMPGSGKVDFPLSSTPDDPSVEHLLIWDSTSVGDLLSDTGFIAKDVDGFATLAAAVPSPPFLPGYVIVIQALLADRCPPGTTCDPTDPPSDPGRIPFALTNAQDLTVTM